LSAKNLKTARILVFLMKHSYGDGSRGLSEDIAWFLDNLTALAGEVQPLWYDAYLDDLDGLQAAALERADSFKPDLIFLLPYTDQFRVETLDALKAKFRTCCWFGDDTWRFDDFSSKLAPHFSCIASTDLYSLSKYRALGVPAIETQWAAEPWKSDLGPLPPAEYRRRVSFVGGYNMVRGWFVNRLMKLGFGVDCFGRGWPSGAISFDEMGRVFRESRINLSLSNSVSHDIRFVTGSWPNFKTYLRSPKRAEQIKARNFEIPLAGGFQLTSYAPGLERYFRIGEEIAVFSSPEDCARQIDYYLGNEEERLRVLRAGHARAESDHTYRRRLSVLLERIYSVDLREHAPFDAPAADD
jgi:spore maturation protein CgeB